MQKSIQVPCLTTALTGPLQLLEKLFLANQCKIEIWLREQWRKTPPPLYSSVDLRNSGFKVAPVDTNLFPAGFNNLNRDFLPLCVQAAQQIIEQILPTATQLLIIPENHTRNIFYLENVAVLQEIFSMAGFEVRLGSLLEELTEAKTFTLPSGKSIILEPLQREANHLQLDGFIPDLILLNNDLSGTQPALLQNIAQPIVPPLHLGWSNRLKSDHFAHYADVTAEFSQVVGVDPWFITPLFSRCDQVDFMERAGNDCLEAQAAQLFEDVEKKYAEHQIHEKPYIVVKADAGSYGMGVMSISSLDELKNLNRKDRTKMATTKGGEKVTRVILQEGVYSFETWGAANSVAEPVVYMMGQHVIGGFYRVHDNKGVADNLNSPGAHFEPMGFMKKASAPASCDCERINTEEECVNRFYSYGVIARLALVAAAREMAGVK